MKKQFKHIVKIERVEIKVNKDDETKCHEECDYFNYSECYRYGYFDINEERMKRHKECINEMGMPSEEEENQ